MRFITFVVLIFSSMLIAGSYGALHDQISFTVSEEYFTKFKYKQFGFMHSDLPDRIKAAIIGYRASWWMGIPIGLIIGAFGFLHHTPRLMFIRSIKALGITTIVALVIGLGGLVYGSFFISHDINQSSRWYSPDEIVNPSRFLAVGYMHNFSYLGGLVGILAGITSQFIQRSKPTKMQNKIE